ncbi:MAG: hypothetical protein AB7P16_23430 [Bradyrhizobium sp.]|uniref:hypothetical protein n=1 Tax=Bradyrhizobium sp. TaxID=376 RepID=UPI003D0DD256
MSSIAARMGFFKGLMASSRSPRQLILDMFAGMDGGVFLPGPASWFTDTGLTTPASPTNAVRGLKNLLTSRNLTCGSAGREPIARLDGLGNYLEFDGVDDFMVSAATYPIQANHYVAVLFEKSAQDALPIFGALKDSTNYHRLVNISNASRVAGSSRETAAGVISPVTPNNSVPINTLVFVDSLLVAGLTDAGVEGVVSGAGNPGSNGWTALTAIANAALGIGINSTTTSIATPMKFRGGVSVNLGAATMPQAKRQMLAKLVRAHHGIPF